MGMDVIDTFALTFSQGLGGGGGFAFERKTPGTRSRTELLAVRIRTFAQTL
jgi:hypothetical protein